MDFGAEDSKFINKDWVRTGRESLFTRMVLDQRISRQKFKESKQSAVFKQHHLSQLSDEKLAEYERMALRDLVTGLHNRRAFVIKLSYELKRAKRYKRPLSLLILSIDGLEAVGRQFGQLNIDDTLKAAAEIVLTIIRDVDIAARVDRDQVAVIFPETYSSRAVVVAERIRQNIKTKQINEEIRDLRVTASIAVVSFPTHAREEESLFNKAIEFLKQAQSQGGNQLYSG